MRDQLQVAPEGGLKEAFQGILHTIYVFSISFGDLLNAEI